MKIDEKRILTRQARYEQVGHVEAHIRGATESVANVIDIVCILTQCSALHTGIRRERQCQRQRAVPRILATHDQRCAKEGEQEILQVQF